MCKVSGLVLLFKGQRVPFSSDLIPRLGEFWVTFTFFSDPVLCCMMAFDHEKVVTKNQAKTPCVKLE